jgi:phosphohistidine phosphatase
MKRLYIVRHGKSTWDLEGIKDIDRPLKERGINDAHKMADFLDQNLDKPELIISSNAIRALHSAVIFHRVLGLPASTLTIDPDLYHADTGEILDVIYPVDDTIDRLMIFGHNPGFTDFVNYLSNLNLMNLPTTGLVTLDFEIDSWTEISRGNLMKERFDFPGNL